MNDAAAGAPPGAALAHWLRLLWDVAPGVRFDGGPPFIARGAIHLPGGERPWAEHAAAAAHAAAHLVYSPASFDGTGLGPVARALVALLEDARVEALAARELPGLARLWRPWHRATPAAGGGFEALLARLARALIDPDFDDPDPWVRKGRALFYLDAGLRLPALRTPAAVRGAALRLGHDIGQMRLGFDARRYVPQPGYRDDHRWMWPAEVAQPVVPPGTAGGTDAATPADDADAATPGGTADPQADAAIDAGTRYPEWDRLIGRSRPRWTRVVETVAGPAAAPPAEGRVADRAAARRLQPALRALAPRPARAGRADEGEVFDLAALVDWRIARRLHRLADARVYRRGEPRPAGASVLLLVDQSASTAAPLGDPDAAAGRSRRAPATDDRVRVGTWRDARDAGPGPGPAEQLMGVVADAAGRAAAAATDAGASGVADAPTVLGESVRAAAALAAALHAGGSACAVAGFSSNGRDAVRVVCVRGFDEPVDAAVLQARLRALTPGGSTRLGAALRHAVRCIGAERGEPRGACWIVVLSDGEPHDIDVHDPRYLVDDARHAVRDAARRGVRVACLMVGDGAHGPAARRVFGARRLQALRRAADLPRALRRVLA